MTKQEAVDAICKAGIPAGPCNSAEEIIQDPHVASRRMLIEVPRDDGVNEPMLVAGMPVKMSRVVDGGESKQPLLGQHTDEVLREVLNLEGDEIASLRGSTVIA
jgi:crotonobetainyl-CoA:carnitine CoA-transferase CaiB-like acyl-CoA transferase